VKETTGVQLAVMVKKTKLKALSSVVLVYIQIIAGFEVQLRV
jgi:hypothetical protein